MASSPVLIAAMGAVALETGSNRGQAETDATLPRASTAGDYPVLGYQLRIHLRGISPPICEFPASMREFAIAQAVR